MIFKNVALSAGDFIAFKTPSVPLQEVQAAVINVEDGKLEVMSTLLAPFQHSGIFTEAEVGEIIVVYPASISIPQESGKKKFIKDQKVSISLKNGTTACGCVVAAFDGVVAARTNEGIFIVGGASFFTAQ